MKRVAKRLKNQEFTEHIDDMQLALFMDKKLDKQQRDSVFEHLSHCKRCRDVLKVASEIAQEKQRLEPVNNIDYMGYLKPFIPFVAGVVLFFGVPMVDDSSPNVSFKGVECEEGIIDRSLDYWERKFNEWFSSN